MSTASTTPDTAMAKNALLAANFFVETNRMEAFVAVYYITFKGWHEVRLGVVSLVMHVVMLAFQTPAGDLLDKTHYKRSITAIAFLVASITTASVVWTSNFWILLVAKTLEGIAASVFLPALMSLLLGICVNKHEVPAFIAAAELSNKIGSVLVTQVCGLMAYFFYPDISLIFYLLAASGLMAVISVLLIPCAAIDDGRARQLQKADQDTIVATLDTVRSVTPRADPAVAHSSPRQAAPISYLVLLQERNIRWLAIFTFVYHLANAAIAPLVAQQLAIQDKRESMVFTAAALLLQYLVQGATAQWLCTAVDRIPAKNMLAVAPLALTLRCALLTVLLQWSGNKYAVCATQLLEGVGAGIYDTMISVVVAGLTEDSGRFGIAFGFILTCWRLGHGVSVLLGESIVQAASYQAAFLVHGAIGVVALLVLVLGVQIPERSSGGIAGGAGGVNGTATADQ